jgi:hypothetical protein
MAAGASLKIHIRFRQTQIREEVAGKKLVVVLPP